MNFIEGMLVGTAAGINCWLFSYPQDIIKTKIQIQSLGTYRNNRLFKDGGFIECGRQIYEKNGLKGFFVGIQPCLIRAAVANGFGIATYEKCQQLYNS